ncbi:hypothetical protein LINPERPRIM_LOCUS37151 [Linum perenne]
MALVRWLLNSSPALDKMEVTLSTKLSSTQKMSIVEELNGFPRALESAQIVFINV